MDQKQQIVDRLKQASNILVTVSTNPSVDQLASCIALTIGLNKLGRHSTAVFSGEVPSTIEFLQPEMTLEKNTDSLRDFIIALDKAKADKLRYKVEDKIVKIFITPYKTSIDEKDLSFSQGEFNVDVVIALGVHSQSDVDQAITAHGRILHDAAIITINTSPGGDLGSINWLEPKTSSLSELVTGLLFALDKKLLDTQIATALLTGIVAETNRFSNEKTSASTMSLSAELMAAGANQQLVVSKLEINQVPSFSAAEPMRPIKARQTESKPEAVAEGGTLQISHLDSGKPLLGGDDSSDQPEEAPMPQIKIDEQGALHNLAYENELADRSFNAAGDSSASASTGGEPPAPPIVQRESPRMILEPPSMGGQLTANTSPQEVEGSGDPMTLTPPGSNGPLLHRSPFSSPASAATANPMGPSMPPSSFGPTAYGPPMASASHIAAPIAPPPAAYPSPFNPNPMAQNGFQNQNPFGPSPPYHSSPPAYPTQSLPVVNVDPFNHQPGSFGPPPQSPAPAAPDADVHSARDAVRQAIASQPAQQESVQGTGLQALTNAPAYRPPGPTAPGPVYPSAPVMTPAGPTPSPQQPYNLGPPPLGPPPMMPPSQP